MSIAIFVVEGVLLEEDSIKGTHPVLDAMRFLQSLNSGYKVVLSADVKNVTSLSYTLEINGILERRSYDQIIHREPRWFGLSVPQLRVAQFRWVRMSKGEASLYIDSDPISAAAVLKVGGNILLWNRAAYSHEDFRPDRPKPRPWAELVDEQEHQLYLKQEDQRLKAVAEESEFI